MVGTLVGLWLVVPPVHLNLGPISVHRNELLRCIPLIVALGACPKAFLHWQWIDLPVVVYCLCPFFAGVLNAQPWSYSAWESAKELSYWWIPFALGRFLLVTEQSRQVLCWVVLMGAAVYLPPALYEVFRGPVLAEWFTGQMFVGMQRGAGRSGGTFRPSVFLSSGFVLTMFYVWAALIAVHRVVVTLRICRQQPGNVSRGLVSGWRSMSGWTAVSAGLMGFVVLCKSLGSVVLMGVGALTIVAVPGRMAGVAILVLCSIPPVYIAARVSGVASTERLVSAAGLFASDAKAGSLRYRLESEDIVLDRMSGRWLLGFGRWGGWTEGAPAGRALDGFWLFALTRTGLLSVAAWLVMVGLPVIVFGWTAARQGWRVTQSAVFPCALFLALSLIDSMFNYFGEAPVMMCCGMLTAWVVHREEGELRVLGS